MERQIFKLSPSARGAIFKLKRWFYANFYTKEIPPEIKEKNINLWRELARKLVEETNKRGISDKATRLTIEYEKTTEGEFKPLNIIIEALELRPVDKFSLTLKTEKEIPEFEITELELKAEEKFEEESEEKEEEIT